MSKALYKFCWDYGRAGSVEGLFIATKDEVADALGKEVFLGEVLGKHSEISGTLDPEDLTLVTEDRVALDVVEKYKLASGHNPLEYIEE